MTEKEYKEIKLGEKIHFNWMDKGGFGWAYFDVCQVWKRGRIVKIYIIPRQNSSGLPDMVFIPDKEDKLTSFGVSSYNCDSEATIRRISYCKHHKALNVSMSVPKNSKYFELGYHFGDEISMEYKGNSI